MAKRNTAIQIGTAASRDIGTGVNQIPSVADYAMGSGWFQLPSGNILQYGVIEMTAPKVADAKGSSFTQTFNFPVAFPGANFLTLTKWDTTNWAVETIVQDGVSTSTSFSVTIFHGANTPDGGLNKFSFLAIGV